MAEEKTEKKHNAFMTTMGTFFRKTGKFFRDCKGEIKKIVWPTPQTVFRNMGVVLVTILVLGVFIFLLDTVFMNILGLVMDIAR